METRPRRWISVLRKSQNRLASIVTPLTPDQLDDRSYDTEWTIAQVLSHLGSQAEFFSALLTAAVDGTDPPGQEFMQPVWDAWSVRGPAEQANLSLEYNEHLVRRFESLTDDELSRMHLSLFGMELDAASLVRLRVGEHAIHTWDIAVALDPAARVDHDAVALLVDTLDSIASRVGKTQGRKFTVSVHTSEPDRRFMLRVGDTVELLEPTDAKVDAEMHLPAESFVRLVYGRLDPDHADDVKATGDVTLEDVRMVFPGV
jgi:uncharacterized protein (TIGR03083 family)